VSFDSPIKAANIGAISLRSRLRAVSRAPPSRKVPGSNHCRKAGSSGSGGDYVRWRDTITVIAGSAGAMSVKAGKTRGMTSPFLLLGRAGEGIE